MIQILDNPFVGVYTSREHQLTEVIWKGRCDADLFRGIMTDVMGHVKSQGFTKWLCDIRALRYILLADQNWMAQVLFPALLPAGERFRFAHVINLVNLELMSSLRIQELVQADPELHR